MQLKRAINSALFVATKHFRKFDVAPEPWFETAASAAFNGAIARSTVYLEYGSGGSTVYASRRVKTMVSVESDALFKRAVERKLNGATAEVIFLRPNVGVTRELGHPLIPFRTPARLKRWQSYPKSPWAVLDARGLIPDTILIDGRFRVACALESLFHIGTHTTMLVDDYAEYAGRNYKAIERFATLTAMHGRMAEFRKPKTFDDDGCKIALAEAYSDPY